MEDITNTLGNSTGIPTPHMAAINYFFPGYTVILSGLNTALGGDLQRYIPFILLVLGLRFAWNYCNGNVQNWLETYFMSSFVVRAEDETYNLLMLWTTKQSFAQKTRNFVVNTDIYSRNHNTWRDDESEDEDEELVGVGGNVAACKKHSLHYTPSVGHHWFWYKRHLLRFERCVSQAPKNTMRVAAETEEIKMSCFGRDPYILKELLHEAREMYLQKDDRKTIIYRANNTTSSYGTDSYWVRCMSRPNRSFSTVILPEKIKADIIADAADYLDARTRRWYANRGIPYRWGYLLYGPPGTGKSSLSLALAGYFRMKIYILSLSSTTLTEENLASLFSDLPNNCVVLLEDIDTAGLTNTREKPSSDPKSSDSSDSKNSSTSQVSLSGLLNVLDGVAAKEGRVLIMTTNHVDKLDKALIRPGRIDYQVPFQLANAEMCESLFRAIYIPYEDEVESTREDTPGDLLDAAAEKRKLRQRYADTKDRVISLAKTFAVKVPENEFSPAELQGLLLRHKISPSAAVNGVEQWVEQMREDKVAQKAAEEERLCKEKEEKEEKERKEEEEKKQDKENKTEIEKEDGKEAKTSEETSEKKDDDEGETAKKIGTSDSGYDS